MSAVAEPVNWSVLGGQMGLGALLGFAVGFTAKKALKVALILLGVGIVVGVLLENYGIISINWSEIEGVYARAVEQAGGLSVILEDWSQRLGSLIPVAGSFTVGFLIGMRQG